MDIVQLEAFKREINEFPVENRDDIFSLVTRFLKGERLHQKEFKTFKVKDHRGNWRALFAMVKDKYFVFVYAFHKKSQELLDRGKGGLNLTPLYFVRGSIKMGLKCTAL